MSATNDSTVQQAGAQLAPVTGFPSTRQERGPQRSVVQLAQVTDLPGTYLARVSDASEDWSTTEPQLYNFAQEDPSAVSE